jgi:hypothetical protein
MLVWVVLPVVWQTDTKFSENFVVVGGGGDSISVRRSYAKTSRFCMSHMFIELSFAVRDRSCTVSLSLLFILTRKRGTSAPPGM